jgi:hypothetical protein
MRYDDVADVLDAVAGYIDGIEFEKQAAEQTAREARISKIASQYEASTGEGVPTSIRSKLAGLDVETLDHLLKVANNNNDSPATLGGPSEISDSPTPRTIKEAASNAEDRLLAWIMND